MSDHGGYYMLYRVEGIVIRSMDYGEGNKIITLCTKTNGKVGILVRGAKKVKSRHAAITQLFTYGEFVYFKTGQLGTLNQGEILESHHVLREQLHLTAYASYVAELLDRGLEAGEIGAFLFEQLNACLTALEQGKDPQITTHLFEMKMLQAAGYHPELQTCVSCGRDDSPMLFSSRLGGTLCIHCKNRDPAAIIISEGTLKLLRLFDRMDMRRLGNIAVKPETKAQMKQCMRTFMDIHMGLHLKSQNFLDQMDKYNI